MRLLPGALAAMMAISGLPALAAAVPLEHDLADERSTRELIHRVSCADGSQLDPVSLIRATNSLLRLGKPAAQQLLRQLAQEFERAAVHDDFADWNRLFLVALLYYEFPPGKRIPRVRCLHGADLEEEMRISPTFPLVVIDDFPLLLASRVDSCGVPEALPSFVAWCERNATCRRALLCPTAAPFQLLEKLERERLWVFDGKHRAQEVTLGRFLIASQTLRAARPAFFAKQKFTTTSIDQVWERLLEETRHVRLRWDSRRSRYMSLEASDRAADGESKLAAHHDARSPIAIKLK